MQEGAVPVHGGSGAEAGEEVVCAGKAADADCEEAEGCWVEEQGFGVDPFAVCVVSMLAE